jgi:hypothetical protein
MQDSPLNENPQEHCHWIVICPEPYVRGGGLWARWYRENCVAAGWPPPMWTLDGPSDDPGWTYTRNRLKEMKPGDRVIPFLLKWRIGPVGIVREVSAADADWNETVEGRRYKEGDLDSELGRRIHVTWERDGMPPDSRCAMVPADQRPQGPLSRHTIDRLSEDKFKELTSVLANPSNWIDVLPGLPPTGDRFSHAAASIIADTEVPPPTLPEAQLALLERDLQRLLSRNLDRIEKGLRPQADYQLEEFPCDVGRLDFLCKDSDDNWVVVELKADWVGDDAVGQILGYMSWVKDNLPVAEGSRVRGILVGRRTSGRVKAAIRLFPGLSIKQFTLDCRIEEMM